MGCGTKRARGPLNWCAALQLAVIAASCLTASQLQASTYYVIVAGIGGEPDYEQRFNAAAKDLEKIFKTASGNSQTYTLAGPEATAARFKDTLSSVAHTAKSEDDFVLVLIGHGSFDG